MKRRITEAEKAVTPLTELIEETAGLAANIQTWVRFIEIELHMSNREACCALRDYAQLMVARHMDMQYEETLQRIKELESQLERS